MAQYRRVKSVIGDPTFRSHWVRRQPWNSEQAAYLDANKLGGGLSLILEAQKWEYNDLRINFEVSRLLSHRKNSFMQLSILVLSMPQDLLESIILGDLVFQSKACLVHLPSLEDHRPCICVMSFVDQYGKAPTAAEMLRILRRLEVYGMSWRALPEGDDEEGTLDEPQDRGDLWRLVRLVDSQWLSDEWSLAWSEAGWRRYFMPQVVHDYDIEIGPRIRILREEIIPTWQDRISRIAISEHYLHLVSPPMECGFTSRVRTRKEQHGNHESSTWAACLLAAVASSLNLPYRWNLQVATYLTNPFQAAAGEAFFTRLARTNTWLGGFNPIAAGYSVDSIDKDFKVGDIAGWERKFDVGLSDQKLRAEKGFLDLAMNMLDLKRRANALSIKARNLQTENEKLDRDIKHCEAEKMTLRSKIERALKQRFDPVILRVQENISQLEKLSNVESAAWRLIESVEPEALRDDLKRRYKADLISSIQRLYVNTDLDNEPSGSEIVDALERYPLSSSNAEPTFSDNPVHRVVSPTVQLPVLVSPSRIPRRVTPSTRKPGAPSTTNSLLSNKHYKGPVVLIPPPRRPKPLPASSKHAQPGLSKLSIAKSFDTLPTNIPAPRTTLSKKYGPVAETVKIPSTLKGNKGLLTRIISLSDRGFRRQKTSSTGLLCGAEALSISLKGQMHGEYTADNIMELFRSKAYRNLKKLEVQRVEAQMEEAMKGARESLPALGVQDTDTSISATRDIFREYIAELSATSNFSGRQLQLFLDRLSQETGRRLWLGVLQPSASETSINVSLPFCQHDKFDDEGFNDEDIIWVHNDGLSGLCMPGISVMAHWSGISTGSQGLLLI